MNVIIETNDAGAPLARRRWWLLVPVVAVLTAVWFIRAAMWPCGALDGSSGCVQRVQLDVEAVGLDPATARVDWGGFDLGPDGKVALVGLNGPGGIGWRGTLALFDAQTGALIQLLDARESADDDLKQPSTSEVALSLNGNQVAAGLYDWDADKVSMTLQVFNVADGSVTTTFPRDFGNGRDCVAMLDFSPDGTKLQCGGAVHDLTNGQISGAYNAEGILAPMYAESVPGERAPDGTVVVISDLPSRSEIFDADANIVFAPDSVGMLEVWGAYHTSRGQRWWTPAPFRYLSGVGVWDWKTKTLQRRFYANERYVATAWARDESHFGFVSDDFQLTVFRR
jgi:hypothetical protein